MGTVELERQAGQLLERDVVIGLRPGPAQPRLDSLPVPLGEMIQNISFLVAIIATSR
jgi:hypothetical protein